MHSVSSRRSLAASTSRFDWVRVSVLTGFIATFGMTATLAAGYLFANAVGDPDGGRIEQWFNALSHNQVAEQVGNIFVAGIVLNLIIGVIWALLYGRFVEPILAGPGWWQGVRFALIPWLLSIAVLFPVMGAGFFGMDLDAGPLPVIGNLIVHIVYGAILGFLYGIEEGSGISEDANEHHANATAERGAAWGVLGGGVLGAIVGFLAAPGFDGLADRPVTTLAGILTGAAIGTLLGSFIGMNAEEEPEPQPQRRSSGHQPRAPGRSGT